VQAGIPHQMLHRLEKFDIICKPKKYVVANLVEVKQSQAPKISTPSTRARDNGLYTHPTGIWEEFHSEAVYCHKENRLLHFVRKFEEIKIVVPAKAGIQASSSTRLIDLVSEKIPKNISKVYQRFYHWTPVFTGAT
jgi:hypothetical protein